MATPPLEFVRVYENILPQYVCKHLVNFMQFDSDKQIVSNNGRPNFTQLNLNQSCPSLVADLVKFAHYGLLKYHMDQPFCQHWFPESTGMEEFRIKRYVGQSEDRYDVHVDVGDLTSCKRYLSLLFYLNDDFDGGETTFVQYDQPSDTYIDIYDIRPKTGSVLIFPPMWMFPHRGRPVLSGAKYIMSTYLNYT
ncbi:2OG-Fe(II) oxygenase superfamily protein [Synechococcus phage S-CRM01]|uniref:2OG-Fe(II) oxygenase n=1 Tax=Synechococcus phage S-CRM01 TaxID=1026955 RepID=UPI000209E3DD|nr:2OG-Fe(II) oxygenase [Synechococcus phage S-CRM01]AEC53086.1 2OG-Fe(II) oxygenase superfamily protein [Synechococcus phage S-CRM01]